MSHFYERAGQGWDFHLDGKVVRNCPNEKSMVLQICNLLDDKAELTSRVATLEAAVKQAVDAQAALQRLAESVQNGERQ